MKNLLLLTWAIATPLLGFSQNDGLEENFNDNTLTGWPTGTTHYTLTEENEELSVDADVDASSYDGFTYTFPEALDLSLIPYIKVKIKANKNCSVRIDLQDSDGWVTNQTAVVKQVSAGSQFTEYTFNFGGLFYQQYGAVNPGTGAVDQSSINRLIIMVNAGGTAFTGTLVFDDLMVGSTTGIEPPTGEIVLNQVGFYPDARKVAIVSDTTSGPFYVTEELSGDTVFTGTLGELQTWEYQPLMVRKADFSDFETEGSYRVRTTGLEDPSATFEIKEDVHHEALKASLKSYYYQRASIELEEQYAGKWARSEGHSDNVVYVHSSAATSSRPEGTIISTPYGWYDAGDYGKYVVNSGISTYQLLALYEHFPSYFDTLNLNIPESENGIPDLLDECLWNLRWMLTMQDEDGGVYHKTSSLRHDGSYMPASSTRARYVIGKGTAATLDFAAVIAQASRIFRKFDDQLPGLSDSMLIAAEYAYSWAEQNPDVAFNNPSDVGTGEYGDGNFSDEFIWARAELLISTFGKEKYHNRSDYSVYLNSAGWSSVSALGIFSLNHYRRYLPIIAGDTNRIKNSINSAANRYVATYNSSAYEVPMGNETWNFTWGSNAVAGNQGMLILQAYRLFQDEKFLNPALANLDYLLGRNGTGYSFLTGFGEKSPLDPHHRPSYTDGVAEPVPGLMVGGPHATAIQGEGCADYPGSARGNRFLDHWCSYSTNENAINYNSAFTYLAGAIEALRYDADYTPPVGTRDANEIASFIKVFPNPVNDVLNIETELDRNAYFRITDLSGRSLIKGTLLAGENTTLNIKTLNAGIYILSISSDESVYSEKVIVR